MRFLKLGFFHQTNSPGLLRDSLKQFPFLANFRGVMYILRRLPGVRDTILKHESNEYIGCCFKVNVNDLKFEKKSQKKKNDSPVSGTPGSHFCCIKWGVFLKCT